MINGLCKGWYGLCQLTRYGESPENSTHKISSLRNLISNNIGKTLPPRKFFKKIFILFQLNWFLIFI